MKYLGRSKNGSKTNPSEILIKPPLSNLGTLENPKQIQIGTDLTPNQRNDMVTLLTLFQDVFAWSHEDMVGLYTDIVIHHLPVKGGFKPVRQKLGQLKPEWILQVKEEIVKQFQGNIIIASTSPE